MATFTYTPSTSSVLTKSPRVQQAQFGDGYSQRIGDGINTILQVWRLSFSPVSLTTADAIDSFLSTEAGVTAFDWTPPGEVSARKFICKEWSRVYTDSETLSMTAVFEEVAE